ncbi:MAG: FtsX-like permease family protein, partial [Pseudomonadota bacterium]
MHGAWVEWDALDQVLFRPAELTGATATYLVRTAPGQRDALIAEIEAHLSASNPSRFIRKVEPYADVVASSYSDDRATAIVLSAVIVMLLVVTSLGIVGLASFSVRQRTKQIGTRRAVGARKIDILRYFLTENWLITTMGIIVGLILTFALNYWLATAYSLDKLDPVYVPLGVLMLWGLGLLSVLGPARRASSVSPAIATRTV